MVKTEQEEFWKGEFGDEYTLRNAGDWDAFYRKQWGVTRTELNNEFLSDLSKDARILEVGCNRGYQLQILQNQGFNNLWGLEINTKALQIARENKTLNLIEGSAFDIPFKNDFFDIVFTSGLLIHIAPEHLPNIMDEIYRTSRSYIWGFEYYSEECVEIVYRGHKNRLWKNNFVKIWQQRFLNLKLIKQQKIPYLDNDNIDMMYLLKKPNG
ncbi:MAG: pseudaminic acid biosynthesis-associated methylase [Candidatus Sifarchaeia archaeon]